MCPSSSTVDLSAGRCHHHHLHYHLHLQRGATFPHIVAKRMPPMSLGLECGGEGEGGGRKGEEEAQPLPTSNKFGARYEGVRLLLTNSNPSIFTFSILLLLHSSFFQLHCPVQHLRQDLRHEVGDLLDEWSGVGHHHCHGLATHGSAKMRNFHLSWDVVVGSLVVLCGAYSVSSPQPPWRTRHRCTY